MSTFEITSISDFDTKPTQFQTLTVVSFVLLALSGLWSFVDIRMVDGAYVWMKPLKFAASFLVLFGTLALLEPRLSERTRMGWPLKLVGWVMTVAFLSEMGYVIYQAGRGEASHFNVSTPFNLLMYSVVMAAGAVALVVCIGVVGWIAKRDTQAQLSPGVREAVWLGFLLSFGLTLIVASYMSSGTSHFVGIHPEGAPVLPLLGWSGVTGDLRPAHFLSLHAMQIIPLLAIWMDRAGMTGTVGKVRTVSAAYAVLTLGIFGMALLKLPLVPLG